jgi:hypothetical protein
MPDNLDEVTVTDLPPGLGGARPIPLPATRYRQGGRTQYHVNLPLGQVTTLIRRPDPSRPLPGNRKVDAKRGQAFGDYLRKNDDWVSPAVIVRVPIHEVQFTEKVAFQDGSAWGVLEIGIDVLTEILLLDGQHRTLGIFIAIEDTNTRIRKLRETIHGLRSQGGLEGEVARQERLLAKEVDARRRLSEEHISIDIVEVSEKPAMQMFGDINNNAKGVNRDLSTVLDQRRAVNRIAMDLIERHVLLEDRVELGQERRMTPTSDKLLGAKAVSDIVHGVMVGTGRVGARVEDELDRNMTAAVQKVSQFLDVLLAGFTTLQEVVAGEVSPRALRDEGSPNRSMLGSVTMLRALAALYHELTTGDSKHVPMSRVEVEAFFRKLEPHMGEIPVTESDQLWWPTGTFLPGSTAPQARQGTVKTLVDSMAAWARSGHPSL